MVFFIVFKAQLRALLGRGDIQLSWGERSIRLRELSEKIEEELDPLRDDLEGLKETSAVEGTRPAKSTDGPTSSSSTDTLSIMKDALANPKFRWRSVDRLAALAYLPESEAAKLLQSDPEVVFGYGKRNKPIARLRSR